MLKLVEIIPMKITDKKLHAAAYIRVSTNSLDQENSFMFQKRYWEEKLRVQGNIAAVKIYADEGISGKSIRQRREFNKLINDALNGKVDIIYTKSISRFARNMIDLVEAVRKLREKNIAIIFEKENLNSLNTKTELLMQLQGVMAEQELRSYKQNVEWSRRKQFAEGKPYMVCMPFGYKQECRPNFVIDEREAAVVKTIFQMYADGNSVRKIVKYLFDNKIPNRKGKILWSEYGFRKMLSNEKYIGDCLLQKTYRDENFVTHNNNGERKQYYIQNNHERIISRELFTKVQERLKESKPLLGKKQYTGDAHRFEFSGKIICACCGRKFRRKSNNKHRNGIQVLWQCSTSSKISAALCENRGIPEELLKEMTLSVYNEYIKFIPADIGKLQTRLEEVIKEQESLYTLAHKRYITQDAYQKEVNHLISEAARLDKEIRCQTDRDRNVTMRNGYDPKIMDAVIKIIVERFTLIFHFDDGQIIERRYYKDEHRKFRMCDTATVS
jgi:DNA invertase Pin-like site-specific DNA recombinase